VLDLPSPPFLYAFAAGKFEVAEHRSGDTLVRAYGPPGPGLSAALRATGSMYQFLSGKLGVGHPWGEYLQVFVEGDIAQEAAGMALIGAQALKDRSLDPEDDWVFIHELAHQWFGWLVPCADFSDFWLNEGFATFMVGAFKESQWGAAAYEREVNNWRQRSAKVRAAGHEAPIALSSPTGAARPAPRDFELQDRGVTYFRGALVLHRLRSELGEEAFWRGLRLYVTTHAGKGARTRDLESALERASGRDLGKFFEQYVYAAAEP
jgi:aminopeptidase N